ncbi:MAG: hypothetical protein GX493_02180, partial [Firmicutes bacterium]|nr:hypothetical protein [Bacillota bacterium]
MRRVFLTLTIALACLFSVTSSAWAMETAWSLELRHTAEWFGPLALSLRGEDLVFTSFYLQNTLWGYAWRTGIVPVEWGPSPAEDLLFSGRQGLLSLWAITDYHGFEILPALHYENFYARLTPRDGTNRWLIGRRYT